MTFVLLFFAFCTSTKNNGTKSGNPEKLYFPLLLVAGDSLYLGAGTKVGGHTDLRKQSREKRVPRLISGGFRRFCFLLCKRNIMRCHKKNLDEKLIWGKSLVPLDAYCNSKGNSMWTSSGLQ